MSFPDSLAFVDSFVFLKLTTRHSNWNLVCEGFVVIVSDSHCAASELGLSDIPAISLTAWC